MTQWILRSKVIEGAGRHRNVLVSFAYLPRNPALIPAQFFSAFLAGDHPVLGLLCSCYGWRSTRQLLEHQPEAASHLRFAVVDCAVWTHLRRFHRYRQYPWMLAPLGDPTVPAAARDEIGTAFCETCSDCKDLGFGRRLHQCAGASLASLYTSGITSPRWLQVLRVWSDFHDGETVGLEDDRAHNKSSRQNARHTKWELIAARCVNSVARAATTAAVSAKPVAVEGKPARCAGSPCTAKWSSSSMRPHKPAIQLYFAM